MTVDQMMIIDTLHKGNTPQNGIDEKVGCDKRAALIQKLSGREKVHKQKGPKPKDCQIKLTQELGRASKGVD